MEKETKFMFLAQPITSKSIYTKYFFQRYKKLGQKLLAVQNLTYKDIYRCISFSFNKKAIDATKLMGLIA